MIRRTALLVPALAAAIACGRPAPSPDLPPARRLPTRSDAAGPARPSNFNALAAVKPGARAARSSAGVHVDEVLGVPTFRWGAADTAGARAMAATDVRALTGKQAAVERARGYLLGDSAARALSSGAGPDVEAFDVHDTGRGAVIVRFRQRVGGVEVFRGTTAVAMDRSGALVARSGDLAPAREVPEGAGFALAPAEAVGRALTDVSGEAYGAGDLVPAGAAGAYETFGLHPATAAARAAVFTRPARAKPVWFRLPGVLEPAYYVEVGLGRADAHDSLEYGLVLSARDGRLLFRKDQVSHAFGYRVYAGAQAPHFPYDGPQGYAGSPHPTGVPDGSTPPFVNRELVTLDRNPLRTRNPSDVWLPAGATASQGNNVDAYADVVAPDGFNGADVRASVTAPGVFDHALDLAGSPATGPHRQAAVTQLFYVLNWLHDWYYDAGFDEASGNAQANNFGRGGAGNDRMRAEAQDESGFDNANMATPSDGSPPRMQMYLWQTPPLQFVRVNAPESAARTDVAGVATEFGPQTFDLTADVVAAVDGAGSAGDGCSALTNGAAMAGKIALVDRGDCSFVAKSANAQAAGAVGVLIRNVADGQELVNMAGDGTAAVGTIQVPVMLVDREAGAAIGTALAAGAVNVTLRRGSSTGGLRDGDLDTSIVAHEWGHYISNRLVGDSNGLDTNMAGGLGEGWSDFHALLLMVREEDALVAANAGFAGVYGIGAYASGGDSPDGTPGNSYYWAIRRVPYSTDFTKNPLTFRHIADGQAIPTETEGGAEIPVQFGASGASNSEVHNAGEVWATMLWEAYAALLNEGPRLSFGEAQARMRDYVVEAYKLTPSSPTLLEARDALLAAALARDPQDFSVIFQAFARRGAGIGAVAPNRYAPDNAGVEESYLAGPFLALGAATVASTAGACDDGDGVLDNGETATVTVEASNLGTAALGATTVTLSSPDGRLTFPEGTTAALAATAPFAGDAGRATVTFRATLAGAARGEVFPVVLTFPEGYLDARVAREQTVELRVNHDEATAASAAEGFESSLSEEAWQTQDAGPGGSGAWTRVRVSAGQHTMLAPAPAVPSDVRLVSPPIVLAAGSTTLTFRHRYQFEGDGAELGWVDGAVLELSNNGGTTWTDVGNRAQLASGAAAYDPTPISNYDGTANPLAGRRGFVGKSPGYPNLVPVTVALGSDFAGQTIRLRFRVGTDLGVGGAGWEIDDVAVSNANGRPFPGLVNDRNVCGAGGAVASAGPSQRVAEGTPVTLDAGASAAEDPDAPLTFSWTQLSGPTMALQATANPAVVTFVAPEVTEDVELTFRVEVTGAGATSADETIVTIADVNKPPDVQVGQPLTVDENTLATLDGSATTDADPGTTLTYLWAQVSGRAVVLANAGTPVATFTAPEVVYDQVLQFRLTVSDGEMEATRLLQVTVRDLNPPARRGGGGGGCGSAGAAGPLALLALAALRFRRRRA